MQKRIAVIAALMLTIIAGWAIAQLNPSAANQIHRTVYRLSEYQRLTGNGLQVLAISPDGAKLALATTNGIYLCSSDSPLPVLIPGAQGAAAQPFFSPDGKWVAYWSMTEGLLKRIPVSGGRPVAMRGLSFVLGAHWYSEDSIAYGMATGGILETPVTKSSVNTLVPGGSEAAVFPQILPTANTMLYTAIVSNMAYVAVKSLKATEERRLLFEGSGGVYLPDGFIVYRSVNNIVAAVPFDVNRNEVLGAPVPLFPGLLSQDKASQYSISQTGALAYIPDDTVPPGHRMLLWIGKDGKEESLAAPPDVYASPKLSPDGKLVALTVKTGQKRAVCVWDPARATMTRLTSDDEDNSSPLWSPDSLRVVYRTSRGDAGFDIFMRPADGSRPAEKLGSIPNPNYILYWRREGHELAMQPFQGLSGEEHPQISPDGRWLAYTSAESGQNEVYVRPFPDVSKGRWLASAQGGTSPLWSPDGRELFYRDAESVIAVPFDPGTVGKVGKPTALFWDPELAVAARQSASSAWDMSADGRFLMLKAVKPVRKAVVLTNWLQALKQR